MVEIPPVSNYFGEKEDYMPKCEHGMPLDSECNICKSPMLIQVGGNHYTKMPIQPFEYSMENGLDPMQHTIIKYVSRFRDKNGVQDLQKAKHVIDMLIEWEQRNDLL